MAFAPRGSRPKATLDGTDQTQRKERMPLLVMGASEPSRTRERVSRKPPLPRPHQAGRVAPTVVTREKDAKAKPISVKARPVPKSSTNVVQRSAPAPTKPKLPPRLKPTGPQVTADALVISAQLVPWISMRIALESQLKPLEATFDDVVRQERQRLDNLEASIKEGRRRSELQGQIEMLEDLQQNKPFATLLMRVLPQIIAFEATEGPHSAATVNSKLQILQDQIQSNEDNDEEIGQLEADITSQSNSVHALQSLIVQLKDQLSSSSGGFKARTRWDSMLSQLEILVDSRLRALAEITRAIPFVRKLQRTRIELEILRMGMTGS